MQRNAICVTLILVILWITTTGLSQAQTSARASSLPPDIQEFPRIMAYLNVLNDQGQFMHGLIPQAIRILEDSQVIQASGLLELRPGAQIVTAITPGAPFGLRNSQGVSRGDIIQKTLQDWASSRRGSDLDDLSLLINNGSEISHLSSYKEWLDALNLGQINYRETTPDLDALLKAVEIAGDPTPRPAMGKTVLWITSPPGDQLGISTDSLIARANQLGVKIHVWMVPVPGAFYPNVETQLQQIAQQTGGQYIVYQDELPLPSLENLFEPLRSIYQIEYDSQIRTSGTHQLAVEVQSPEGPIAAPIQSFEVNLLPPEPAFVSPPIDIRRVPPVDGEANPVRGAELTEYVPGSQQIQILVAFPDERIRPLRRTTLFVDGQIIQENRQPPFEEFTWSLVPYNSSGTHILRVEAEDSLGLVGSSIERLVMLSLELPQNNPWTWVYENLAGLSIIVAIVAGLILLLVLLLGGRLRPRTLDRAKRARRRSDPVTQPVTIKEDAPSRTLSGWVNRIQWPQRHITPTAYAFLHRIAEGEGDIPIAPIPITVDEITFGSDPNLATLVLEEPSVEGLHARLLRNEAGIFRLKDEGSIAGTWINYTPVSREGAYLEHDDLIHIGRIGFRFKLRQASEVRRLVVTPVNPPQEDNQ